MALTLGMTGMDRQTEAEVTVAFKSANTEIGGHWSLTDSDSADYVIIDMDSLYGPMSWLRLHAMGRKVIGLTSVDRQQTDFRLTHPIRASDLVVLLSEIETDVPLLAASAAAAAAKIEAAPAPADATPHATAAEAADAPPAEPEPHTSLPPEPEPAPEPAASEPIPPPEPETVTRTLQQWLLQARLPHRVRLQHRDAPPLLIDLRAGVWHGSASLKPLAPHFTQALQEADFETLDEASWKNEATQLGPAQPLARLLWLAGLLSNAATHGLYLLKKWPQTEREYPKHFRIATVMMKGPASIENLATAAGVSTDEVADFVNANLATGYAEPAAPAGSTPEPASTKSGGLFGRLRGH